MEAGENCKVTNAKVCTLFNFFGMINSCMEDTRNAYKTVRKSERKDYMKDLGKDGRISN